MNSPEIRKEQPQEIINSDILRTLRSEDLLLKDKEVLIQHRDDMYRLRITRNDKLILVK